MKTENYTLLRRITRKLDAKLGSCGLDEISWNECIKKIEMGYAKKKNVEGVNQIKGTLVQFNVMGDC